ncbi:hypothetical protein AQUSIP_21940 [Aquicella siphonis]|uniref:Uncharacterized protein n=1 Tax=Aquicella siphonis TaxID=254247 RepID=A0A5E4PKC5_9COXI|nr:hypothetical protein AQUSIP_21940 [Aquicella siphonis]
MWREWISLFSVFTVIFLLVNFMNSTSSLAQPESSTILNPPPSGLAPKSMQCYGSATISSATWRNSTQCAPLTDTTHTSDCNSGEVVTAVKWDADWTSTVDCSVKCATVSTPQSNCQWR